MTLDDDTFCCMRHEKLDDPREEVDQRNIPVPRLAAINLAAMVASDELKMVWTVTHDRAVAGGLGGEVTVVRHPDPVNPFRISFEKVASPKMVLASMHGVSLLSITVSW
ncbi:MAG TPA: hypothetical protein VGM77_11210 [Gemmatimonadales bacterium]